MEQNENEPRPEQRPEGKPEVWSSAHPDERDPQQLGQILRGLEFPDAEGTLTDEEAALEEFRRLLADRDAGVAVDPADIAAARQKWKDAKQGQ